MIVISYRGPSFLDDDLDHLAGEGFLVLETG